MKQLKLVFILGLISYQTTFSQDIIVQEVLTKYQLGLSQFNKGEYDSALTIFDGLIKEVEKDTYDSTSFDELIIVFENDAVLDFAPEIYLYRAKCNIHLKLNANVCEDLETAIMLNVYDALLVARENCPSIVTTEFESNWNFNIGSDYYWDKDYLSSIPYLTKAIELNPYNRRAFETRALSYWETDQLDKALADYRMIITLNPEEQSYYTNCGEILFELNRFEEAISDLNKALKFDPSDIFAIVARGKCFRTQNKYKEAIKDFDSVIKEAPFQDIYLERARAYLGLGDKKNACKDLNKLTDEYITDEVKEFLRACDKK